MVRPTDHDLTLLLREAALAVVVPPENTLCERLEGAAKALETPEAIQMHPLYAHTLERIVRGTTFRGMRET